GGSRDPEHLFLKGAAVVEGEDVERVGVPELVDVLDRLPLGGVELQGVFCPFVVRVLVVVHETAPFLTLALVGSMPIVPSCERAEKPRRSRAAGTKSLRPIGSPAGPIHAGTLGPSRRICVEL